MLKASAVEGKCCGYKLTSHRNFVIQYFVQSLKCEVSIKVLVAEHMWIPQIVIWPHAVKRDLVMRKPLWPHLCGRNAAVMSQQLQL